MIPCVTFIWWWHSVTSFTSLIFCISVNTYLKYFFQEDVVLPDGKTIERFLVVNKVSLINDFFICQCSEQ